MGRAQRREVADRFAAVLGNRRGAIGEVGLDRRAAGASPATLMNQLYSEDPKERRAAAKAFRDRLRENEDERLSNTERQILWAHCTGSQADQATREAIIDGLCAEMLKVLNDDGETPEVASAIVFLASNPSDERKRASERKVISTLMELLTPEMDKGVLPSRSPILEDAYSHLFDGLQAVPQSRPLAALMGALHAACREKDVPDGGLHEQMRQFVAWHRTPSDLELIRPTLSVWLNEGLRRPDNHDQALLTTLAAENPEIEEGSVLEEVLDIWAEQIGRDIYDPIEAGWKALAAHVDREGDGYDVLRTAMGEVFSGNSVGYVGQMHAKRVQGILAARDADGDLPELAQSVLAVLCDESARANYAELNNGAERKPLAGLLASLPDEYRSREDVQATAALCAEGAASSLRAEVSSYCASLKRDEKGARTGHVVQPVTFDFDEEAFQRAVSAGADPYESVRQAVLPQVVDLYARAASDKEGVIVDILGQEKYEGIIPGARTLKKGKYHKVLVFEDWQEIYRKGLESNPTSHLIGSEWAVAPGEKSLFDPLIEQLIS